jgi:uncharacterized repeat protein (TIGR03803 family)
VYGNGQVFQLVNDGNSWTETGIAKFDGTNGANPYAGVMQDSTGAYYTTTSAGDTYGYGNVVKISQVNGKWKLTRIWTFGTSDYDGLHPYSDLIEDSKGNIYGTTFEGGTFGYGAVFELSPSGKTWKETILYSFCSSNECSDGWNPVSGLYMDDKGALYGTTVFGGSMSCGVDGGCGVVFQLTNQNGAWTETVLHTFAGGSDGSNPQAGLIVGPEGVLLYGETVYGGGTGCGGTGCGTVYTMDQLKNGSWKEKVIHSFAGGTGDGANPDFGELAFAPDGYLIGTTTNGGSYNGGTIFEMWQTGNVWNESGFYDFGEGEDGRYPLAGVVLDADGNPYGTTVEGGEYGYGMVWHVATDR